MRTLVVSCYGVEIRVVDTTVSRLTRRLWESLPPECTVSPGQTRSTVLYEVHDSPASDALKACQYRLSRDREHCLETSSEAELLRWLIGDIDRAVAERSENWLFVHAGVVAWKGHAIVIPGRSMSGKSTLVAALVRQGATYYSDEYAVMDAAGNVHPYRRTLVLRGIHGERQTAPLRGAGGSQSSGPLPLALVVAAPYQPTADWCPRVVRGTRAVLPLIDCTVVARSFPEKTLRLAARLASTVATLAGPRGEAEHVAPQILDLLDDALASQASAAQDPVSPLAPYLATEAARLYTTAAAPAFQKVVAPRYLRIEDFLTSEEHERLLDFALRREEAFQSSTVVGDPGTDRIGADARRSKTLYELDEIWDIFHQKLRHMLPFVRRELGVRWFPLDRIERQLTAHAGGGFYHAHRDNGEEEVASRRLTCVYHFHATPRRFTGGELRLYDMVITGSGSHGASTFTSLNPLDNSVVFFPSDALHEVCAVTRDTVDFRDSRFAVTIWFRETDSVAPQSGSAAL